MGVDAEMIVRIKGTENHLAPEDEIKTAYEMASTFGAHRFFVWGTPGEDDFHHALRIMQPNDEGLLVYEQDGPEIIAEPDEQLIKVFLFDRYYGPGYERGDWPFFCMIAEWLEWKFPKGRVWYGGDSGGICAEPLTKEKRDELTRHFFENGHRPYVRGMPLIFARGSDAPDCPTCQTPLYSCGGGRGDAFFACDGCGIGAVSSNGRVTWGKNRHQDIFDIAAAHRANV